MKKISLYGFAAVTAFLLLGADVCMAHKVIVFAWVDGDTVYGESKFSGGRPAKGAEVIVSDADGNPLLNTKTDDEGNFSFPVPRKTDLRIELLAGTGHKGEWVVPESEILQTAGNTKPPPPAEPALNAAPKPLTSVTDTPQQTGITPDAKEMEALIENAVERVMDRKMKPVLKKLAESQQKEPGMTEIIGGIGYIVGLMGIYLFARTRQSSPEKPDIR